MQPVGVWEMAEDPYEHGAVVAAVRSPHSPLRIGDRLLTVDGTTVGVRPEGPLPYGDVVGVVLRAFWTAQLPCPVNISVARAVRRPTVDKPRFQRWGDAQDAHEWGGGSRTRLGACSWVPLHKGCSLART
jgi:hypothetical protein